MCACKAKEVKIFLRYLGRMFFDSTVRETLDKFTNYSVFLILAEVLQFDIVIFKIREVLKVFY